MSLNLVLPDGPERSLVILEWFSEDAAPGAKATPFSDEI
jgi:hypothetical protein